MAVLVHHRDEEQARHIAIEWQHALVQEARRQASEPPV
jgi:hypothetical protein